MTGTNVRPLTEIGLAENHGPGLTQLRSDESVGWRARSEQRQRSRRRIHAVRGIDIVLDEYWNAVKRPARPFRFAFLVKRVGDLESIGVELDDSVNHGSSFVDLRNACQVFLAQGARRILAGLEGLLEIVNRDLVEFEVLLEVLLEVLDARPRRRHRHRIGNASRAKRRVSSRGKSRGHAGAKEV